MSKKWVVSRKTINMSQQSMDALVYLLAHTGETETSLFNRAIQEMASALKEKDVDSKKP